MYGHNRVSLCFLATHPLWGVIALPLRRWRLGGWAAYFCTDAQVDVRDILETVAARWAIEEYFHDVKGIWGAGEQQVRNIWSNIGCWHLNQWMDTLVELCVNGSNSLNRMPGTLVLIGLNGPRIASGASGIGSNVSCCGGPRCSHSPREEATCLK